MKGWAYRTGFVALVIGMFAIAGCGSDDNGTNGGGDTGGDFDISVTSGTRPTYTWDAGPAFSLSVTRTANPTVVVWGLADNPLATGNFDSPIQHGVTPTSALESNADEKTLTAGVEYRVSVTLPDGRTAWKVFTP